MSAAASASSGRVVVVGFVVGSRMRTRTGGLRLLMWLVFADDGSLMIPVVVTTRKKTTGEGSNHSLLCCEINPNERLRCRGWMMVGNC